MMPTSSAPRFAGLDGLRAIAVLLVVVCHLFPGWFLHSGFVGVDVFFVISGFLITSLLLRERKRSGRVALGAFWVRRARRLLPALAAVVTICTAAAWVIGGDVVLGLGRQVLGAATFSYNWLSIAAGASYFSAGQPELFRNLWSLAVEEQFYVLWPLLLPLVLLARARWSRVGIALAAATGSAVWALVAATVLHADATRVYYGTDTHAFGLLLGVALAFARTARTDEVRGTADPQGLAAAWRRLSERTRAQVLAGVGVTALGALIVVASWPGGGALFPVVSIAASLLTAVLIAVSVAADSPVGRALDTPPLRWIGARSYGIYLWHWPLLVLLAAAVTGRFVDAAVPVPIGLAALALTLIASALSYRLLEQPVRRLGFRGALASFGARLSGSPLRRFRAVLAVAGGLVIVTGSVAAVTAPPRSTSSEAVVQAGADALARASAAPAAPTMSGSAPGPAAGASAPPAPTDPRETPQPPAVARVSGDRVTAIGDSVMLASADGLLTARPGIQIDAAVSRSMWAGVEIVQSLSAQGALRENVVVGLGTNGPVDDGDLQAISDAVGPHRTLVLVTAFAPRDWIPGVNAELTAFAASHPRVVIADWAQAIAPHVDLLAGDEIHPGASGGEIYAQTVGAALDAAQNQRAQMRYRVDLIRAATLQAFDPAPAPTP